MFQLHTDNQPELDETPTQVVRFYARSERAWVLYFANAAGEQLGSAEYIGNGRKAADLVESQMLAQLERCSETH